MKYGKWKKGASVLIAAVMTVNCLPVSALTAVAAEAEKPEDSVTAMFGTPVIDGEWDEVWERATAYTLEQPSVREDAQATVRLLWDDNALYVYAEVQDDNLDKSASASYQQDSLEVFLDELYDRATSYQDDDLHYRVNYDNEKTTDSGDSGRWYTATKTFDRTIPVEKAEVKETEVGKAENTVSTVTAPEVTGPEAAAPEVTEPEAADPDVAEPEAADLEATEPEVSELVVTVFSGAAEPEVADPEAVESEAAEPEVTDPEAVESEVAEPEVTDPEVADPEAVEFEAAEPEVTDPEAVESEAAEPEVTEPEVADPEAVESEAAEPEVADPEAVESEAAAPEVREPEAAEPEVTEAEDEEPKVEKGYIVEACLRFDNITPENGTVLGFDAQVNVAADGSRKGTISLFDTTGNAYQNPTLFGRLVLEGKGDGDQSGTFPYSLMSYLEDVKKITLDGVYSEESVAYLRSLIEYADALLAHVIGTFR